MSMNVMVTKAINTALTELEKERARVAHQITALKDTLRISPQIFFKKKPVVKRKKLSATERKKISERMTRYWAAKRVEKQKALRKQSKAERTLALQRAVKAIAKAAKVTKK